MTSTEKPNNVLPIAGQLGSLDAVKRRIPHAYELNPPLARLLESVVAAWEAALDDIENLTPAEAKRWGEVCRAAGRIAGVR